METRVSNRRFSRPSFIRPTARTTGPPISQAKPRTTSGLTAKAKAVLIPKF